MQVANHRCVDELQAHADRESNRRIAIRLRAVILALQGWKTLKIVDALGASRRVIQEWIARYNAEGLDGLTVRPKIGRPSFLTSTYLEQFRERIGSGTLPVDGTCTLR